MMTVCNINLPDQFKLTIKYQFSVPFGIGGGLALAGSAWEGGTRIAKGLIGMGDLTDENQSLGVRSYASLSADDLEDDYPPRRRHRFRKDRRMLHHRRQRWRRNRRQQRRFSIDFE